MYEKTAIKIDNLCNTDSIDFVLNTVHELGYTGIEIYNPSNIDANLLKKKLSQYNLEFASTHVTFEYIMDSFEDFLTYQKALGCHNAVMTYGEVHGPESLALLIDNLNAIYSRLKLYNINLIYHNHRQEFRKYGNNGLAIDNILDKTNVLIEYDPLWAYLAGIDPVEFYKKYADRIKLVHLKDITSAGHFHIEEGRLMCQKLYKCAVENKADWLIVEPSKDDKDILYTAKKTMEYMKSNF